MLVAALMISIGAQWAVLQSAAWIGMAVSYSLKAGSVSEGLSQTFDGKHPCKLCCLVKKGSDSEKKDPKQQDAKKKLELCLGESQFIALIPDMQDACTVSTASDRVILRATAPPVPPPRPALV